MLVNGEHRRTLTWLAPGKVEVLDQRWLPHQLVFAELASLEQAAWAIREMVVRGAPNIGVTAAYGLYLTLYEHPADSHWRERLAHAAEALKATRPTAVNLAWAVDAGVERLLALDAAAAPVQQALDYANQLAEDDVSTNHAIGEHGLEILKKLHQQNPDRPLNILTHCNAGWLGCVDYGTATSPLYLAQEAGIPLHVWVDETRPRNQGAQLTAWELAQQGIPHTLIVDNTGGLLMQQGQVDVCLVGTDRVARNGDVANKIGTYLKALAAHDNQVPFYVALPSSTIDWQLAQGVGEIPIEERKPEEVTHVQGRSPAGDILHVQICPDNTQALNLGFDITPARLVTGLITERGVCPAHEPGLLSLFPQAAANPS